MLRKRIVSMLVVLGLVAGVGTAEPIGGTITANGTSALTTLSRAARSLVFITGDGTTENTVVVGCRVFTDVDTVGDAVLATAPIKIAPGEAFRINHDSRATGGIGFIKVTCITAGTTAKLRYVAD